MVGLHTYQEVGLVVAPKDIGSELAGGLSGRPVHAPNGDQIIVHAECNSGRMCSDLLFAARFVSAKVGHLQEEVERLVVTVGHGRSAPVSEVGHCFEAEPKKTGRHEPFTHPLHELRWLRLKDGGQNAATERPHERGGAACSHAVGRAHPV